MNYEIDFLPVGDSNGDAICLRYGSPGSFCVHVIDGGFTDTAETVVEHIRRYYGRNAYINHLVLSHADNDHACGLIGVLENIHVEAIWMNRPWLYVSEIIDSFHGNWTRAGLTREIKDKHPYLVELEAIANRRGIPIYPVFAGCRIGQCFTVLAPSKQRYISLLPELDKTPLSYEQKASVFTKILEGAKDVIDIIRETWNIESLDDDPPPTSASNETSVVQLGILGNQRVLLTADVGPEGLREAAAYAQALNLLGSPNFIQVPHHGSRRNVTPSVLNQWLGQPLESDGVRRGVAFCSVGKDADKYPRKKVSNAFLRRGYPVYATRGKSLRHHYGWGDRPGWSPAQPEPFYADVED